MAVRIIQKEQSRLVPEAHEVNKRIDTKIELALTGYVNEPLLKNTLTKFVKKEPGKQLSQNDFNDALLAKLNSIEEKAQVNAIDQLLVGNTSAISDKTVKFSEQFQINIETKEIEISENIILDAGTVQ